MAKASTGKEKKAEQSANSQKVLELPLPVQTYSGHCKASCL